MDERFEKLFNLLLTECVEHFEFGNDHNLHLPSDFSVCLKYCSFVIQDILCDAGFESDLLDYLKVKSPAAYDYYFERKKSLSVFMSKSDAGSTSAQSVS